jgi:predicted DNA-binding ribbon-helix-helix protein
VAVEPPPQGFAGPVKRSVTIAGHPTSVSLEPAFWAALERAAAARALPLSALVAEVDALRVAQPGAPNLASALRTWLLADRERSSRLLADCERSSPPPADAGR